MQVKTDSSGNKIINDFYIYTVSILTLAAGGVGTGIINIEADANFTWVKTTYMVDLAGAAQQANNRVIPIATVSILDSGSGRNLQNNPVPIYAMAGDGMLPFVLPVPRTFKARSTISFTFTNGSAATTYNNLTLALIGYKSFML